MQRRVAPSSVMKWRLWVLTDYGLNGLGDGLHWWQLDYVSVSPSQSPNVLLQMHIDFQLEHLGYTFNLYDMDMSPTEPVGTIHFPATPEPATLAFMVAGALSLRRRRKWNRSPERE